MRPETERLVRESWPQFEPIAESARRSSTRSCSSSTRTPQRLFARTDMEAQGRKVMHMFAEIVRTLDQPEELVAEVADLGRRHVGYGVQDDQYDSVGTALLWTLERGLGSAFTAEVRDAWTEAYLLCASIVRRGAAQVTG